MDERVSLFSPLCLMNLVPGPGAIFPQVRGGAGVHRSYKGQQPLQTGHAVQLLQEAAPQHVVICPHAVNGKHCTLRICVGERPARVSDAISARPCGEGELVWCTNCFNGLPELTSQRLRNQPPERRAGGDPTHTTILFLQGCHGRAHKGSGDAIRCLGMCQIFSCMEEQMGRLRIKHSLTISYVLEHFRTVRLPNIS